MLERSELAPQTIDAVGDVIARTRGSEESKSQSLDGFHGLWSRVEIDVDPLGFANLEDRIARKQGQPQPFGTLARDKVDYATIEAERIYAAHRQMIGLDPDAGGDSGHGEVELAMATPVYRRFRRYVPK